jgi:PPOX class probable F420-dependent enzyme
MDSIPEAYRDLLKDEVRAYAFLATTMDDGSPQVTPLWFDVEGDRLRINTARGRVKDRNMRARSRVALAIFDPGNLYRYLQVRGMVVEMREQGAEEHIRALSSKYRGTPEFEIPTGQVRVMFLIRPDQVHAQG